MAIILYTTLYSRILKIGPALSQFEKQQKQVCLCYFVNLGSVLFFFMSIKKIAY